MADGEISSEGTTQGDPLAMAMYAIAVKPLIGDLKSDDPNVKQVWYADDATSTGTIQDLREFWDSLKQHGAKYGYHPNATKTHLVVNADYEAKARELFADTGVNVTTDVKRHLGAAIGSGAYTMEYVSEKVKSWCNETSQMVLTAKTQPHSAYSAYIHGLSNRWTFLTRTIPDISELLQPLERITGSPPCSQVERDLLALPVTFGGLGITNPAASAQSHYEASYTLTTPLDAAIATQNQDHSLNWSEIKSSIHKSNCNHQKHNAEHVYNQLTPQLKRSVYFAKEKGSSS